MMHLRHRWVSLAAEQMWTTFTSPLIRYVSGQETETTEVLQRCAACPKIRTVSLDGHWTIEQVREGLTDERR